MANTKQAKKRVRQAESKRQNKMGLRSRMRTYLKKFKLLLEENKGKKEPKLLNDFQALCKKLDSSSSKGLIHKNKAARLKSRLHAQLVSNEKAA
ncbi:MAG TPA: 30S ribosomal protein S20 [Gammaproteobacteria bacterium]|nr:30S ribosomal protein S20 [Gammaproteobacteria bacterium]